MSAAKEGGWEWEGVYETMTNSVIDVDGEDLQDIVDIYLQLCS